MLVVVERSGGESGENCGGGGGGCGCCCDDCGFGGWLWL